MYTQEHVLTLEQTENIDEIACNTPDKKGILARRKIYPLSLSLSRASVHILQNVCYRVGRGNIHDESPSLLWPYKLMKVHKPVGCNNEE